MDEIDRLIESAFPDRGQIIRHGCCPHGGESAQILFEHPGVIGPFRGYHRQVCHTHKVKSAGGDRYLSTWQHLTPEELEKQYRLLDSYEKVNFDWMP
jgi:hypothetical protein